VPDNPRHIVLPELPAIPGLTFRQVRGVAELNGIAAVMNASLAADRSRERITAEGLATAYRHATRCDLQQDALLVEINGRLTGYASMERYEVDDGSCLYSILLYLVPEWRGRGLELAMQRYMEQRARIAAAARPDGSPHSFASLVPDTWQAWIDMLFAQGYAPVRYYFEMQRSLDGDLPAVCLPAGLELRPPLPEHYRAVWQADVESDRDNWGHVAHSEEDYCAWVETPDLDPSLWCVAWDGDQVAGGAINVAHEGGWGETDDLFVRRPWRRRGLGRALLAASLHVFKTCGLTTAGLGVDAENPSGAVRLYESLGYRPYQRLASYRKPM